MNGRAVVFYETSQLEEAAQIKAYSVDEWLTEIQLPIE